VVVDDGSVDGSRELAEQRARIDPRVRVLEAGGAGAVAARALGVASAGAELLAFTDSDCEPVPGWLAAGVAALDGGCDLAQGRTEPARPVGPGERSLWAPREDGLYPTCNVFCRRTAYDAAGGFDVGAAARFGFRPGRYLRGLGFGEDVLLGWALRRRGTTAFVADAVVRHHVFPPDPGGRLRRAWNTGAFAGLVREVPELRRTFLRHRVFLGGPGRAALLVAAGLGVAGHRRAAAPLAVVWLVERARPYRAWAREEPGRVAATLAVDAAADLVAATALSVGSVRSRTLVL
jgi:glycosyltransferase involved in cell wall biosynthesis